MSLHINRFIDAIKAAESKSQRDFIMTMTDAKALHADITKLLLAIHELHERTTVITPAVNGDIEVNGGSF